MTLRRIRVLIADDSAFARKVLRELLSGDPEIEVVGQARDGLETLEKISELRPDVLTLDLMMPHLDGVGVLRTMMERRSSSRVIAVTVSGRDTDLGVAALAGGAVDLVRKPTALATQQLYDLGSELRAKVKLAAAARSPAQVPRVEPATAPRRASSAASLVAIGTSTGGPQALARLLPALPADLPAPVVIGLHIPAEYTAALAERLAAVSALRVHEAHDGAILEPGTAILAKGGLHLHVTDRDRARRLRLDIEPLGSAYVPSIDVLLSTSVAVYGPGTLAVVLTGMGNDGLEGARAVRAAGGQVLVEAESTCIVYGMPRVISEAGLADVELPLDQLARAIVERL